MTDWILIFRQDRDTMVRQMRQNTAADVLAGYSIGEIARQMADIERYEKETLYLLMKFNEHYDPQRKAYEYLKKVGAIA